MNGVTQRQAEGRHGCWQTLEVSRDRKGFSPNLVRESWALQHCDFGLQNEIMNF